MSSPRPPIVLAAACHPDDIEFMMAGTLLLLQRAGCEIHMWNLSDGCHGSLTQPPEEVARVRWREAQASAQLARAAIHPPLFHDLAIFYDAPSLARVASVLRSIRPQIILTHSPDDYMEDHQNVCRLLVTAAFAREMPHFPTEPPHPPCRGPVRFYHAAPHGLRDGLERPFQPGLLIDIASVLPLKEEMLSCHRSQQDWLAASQGMNAYVDEMASMGRTMALAGRGMEFAEGWRRHSHLGYCPPDFDPLPQLLGDHCQLLNP